MFTVNWASGEMELNVEEGVIDIRKQYGLLIKECVIGLVLCVGFIVRPLAAYLIQDPTDLEAVIFIVIFAKVLATGLLSF